MTPPGSASGSSVSRAVWYGLSTWTPAEGRSQSTAAIPIAASTTARRRRWRQRTPDEEQHGEARRCTRAVPRSGWRKTRNRPAASLSAYRIVRQRLIRPTRSTRKPAIASTKDLPELGRLELDEPEVDPALRAADRLGGDEDDHHEPERRPVHEPPVAPRGVHRREDRERHPDDADRGGAPWRTT